MRASRKINLVFAAVFLIVNAAIAFSQQAPKSPLTVAEATNYDATSRYADVMAFIRELQKQSPLLRVETLCRSAEGRDVPLLVTAPPS